MLRVEPRLDLDLVPAVTLAADAVERQQADGGRRLDRERRRFAGLGSWGERPCRRRLLWRAAGQAQQERRALLRAEIGPEHEQATRGRVGRGSPRPRRDEQAARRIEPLEGPAGRGQLQLLCLSWPGTEVVPGKVERQAGLSVERERDPQLDRPVAAPRLERAARAAEGRVVLGRVEAARVVRQQGHAPRGRAEVGPRPHDLGGVDLGAPRVHALDDPGSEETELLRTREIRGDVGGVTDQARTARGAALPAEPLLEPFRGRDLSVQARLPGCGADFGAFAEVEDAAGRDGGTVRTDEVIEPFLVTEPGVQVPLRPAADPPEVAPAAVASTHRVPHEVGREPDRRLAREELEEVVGEAPRLLGRGLGADVVAQGLDRGDPRRLLRFRPDRVQLGGRDAVPLNDEVFLGRRSGVARAGRPA